MSGLLGVCYPNEIRRDALLDDSNPLDKGIHICCFVLHNKITFVRTWSLSNAATFFERAYLATKHTEVTINTSLTSSVI